MNLSSKRSVRKYYLNDDEYNDLLKRVDDSRHNQVGAYVRDILLKENKSIRHINPSEFLREVSNLAIQVNKTGTNINQLAKHANEMRLNNMLRPELADAIYEIISDYVKKQDLILDKLKELIKV